MRVSRPRAGQVTFDPRVRDAVLALAVGAGHTTWLFAATGAGFSGPALAWTGLGLTLLAALPAFLLLRRLLVVPAAGVVWLSVTVALASPPGSPLGPMGIYAFAWSVPLLGALALGGIEYAVRRWTGLARPKPIARL